MPFNYTALSLSPVVTTPPTNYVIRIVHTYGHRPTARDAVAQLFSKEYAAFAIGSAVLQHNKFTSGDGLQLMMHGSLLRHKPRAVPDLVVVRTVIMDQKWHGTVYPYGFGGMESTPMPSLT